MGEERHTSKQRDNLELGSKRAQQFIGQKPSRLVLMGTTVVVLVITALLLLLSLTRNHIGLAL